MMSSDKLFVGADWLECDSFYTAGGPSADYLFPITDDYIHKNLAPDETHWAKDTFHSVDFIPLNQVASEIHTYKNVSFLSREALSAVRKLMNDKFDPKKLGLRGKVLCIQCRRDVTNEVTCWWCGKPAF